MFLVGQALPPANRLFVFLWGRRFRLPTDFFTASNDCGSAFASGPRPLGSAPRNLARLFHDDPQGAPLETYTNMARHSSGTGARPCTVFQRAESGAITTPPAERLNQRAHQLNELLERT